MWQGKGGGRSGKGEREKVRWEGREGYGRKEREESVVVPQSKLNNGCATACDELSALARQIKYQTLNDSREWG